MKKKKSSVISMVFKYTRKGVLIFTSIFLYMFLAIIVAVFQSEWSKWLLLALTILGTSICFVYIFVIPFIQFLKVWYPQMKLASSLGYEWFESEEEWWVNVLFNLYEGKEIFDLPEYYIGLTFQKLFPESKIRPGKVFLINSCYSSIEERKTKIKEYLNSVK